MNPNRTLLVFALVFPLLVGSVTAQDDDKKTLTVTTDSDTAKEHFWQGIHDVENVFFNRATSHFAAAVAADPDFALAQFMHDVYVAGPSTSERVETLKGSIDDIASASTAELLFATGVLEQVQGNNANALALFAATADLVPDDPHVAYLHSALVGAGGSPERIASLRKMTERFPEIAGTYNTLGYALFAAGDESGGRAAIAKYMELEPNHPNSHDSYAELLQFSGMFSQAAKHYQRAIDLDEDYFAGYTGLSEALLLAGDANGARKVLAEARKHAPNATALANLTRSEANTYFMEGNGEKGLSTLKEATTALANANSTGTRAQTHRELAVAEAMYGDKSMIATHISRATELQSQNVTNHAWEAIAYGIAGDVDAARKATRAFDDATRGNNFTMTLDGLVLLVSGEHAAAEKTLMESGLNNPWATAFMVRCQKEMGNKAEAVSLERDIMANTQFTANNFGYTLSRLTLMEHGTGHVRAGMEQD
jgi:tetratricopeptide (TPR) repeat protein